MFASIYKHKTQQIFLLFLLPQIASVLKSMYTEVICIYIFCIIKYADNLLNTIHICTNEYCTTAMFIMFSIYPLSVNEIGAICVLLFRCECFICDAHFVNIFYAIS